MGTLHFPLKMADAWSFWGAARQIQKMLMFFCQALTDDPMT